MHNYIKNTSVGQEIEFQEIETGDRIKIDQEIEIGIFQQMKIF